MEEEDENQVKLLEEYNQTIDDVIYGPVDSKVKYPKKEQKRIGAEYKERGLKFRYGRWTLQEKRKLHNNFIEFVKENEDVIGDPVDFIKKADDKERRLEVLRLQRQLHFFKKLASGLFREIEFVICHRRDTLDPLAISNGQKYSVEDLHKLKCLVEQHHGVEGKKGWGYIGECMGRSAVSVQSVYRNFFYHEDYKREKPTKKQQRKMIKLLQNLNPDKDLTCELLHQTSWNTIADQIGHNHGKYLHSFWEAHIKVRREDGKIGLKPVRRKDAPPERLIRKFVRHVAKQKPTHLDALNWDYYYSMLSAHLGGVGHMKSLLTRLMNKYHINSDDLGLPVATKKLRETLKQVKKLGFKSIWQEISQTEICKNRWQTFHWVLSPELAHYGYNRPVMYWGFQENQVEPEQEPNDIDEVW